MKINTHSNSVFDLRISPDQDKFACSLIDAPLKIFSLETGELLASHTDSNMDSSWSLDWFKFEEKEFIVSGYGDSGYIRIIDTSGKDKLAYLRKSEDFGYPDAAQLHSNSVWKVRIINNESYSVADDGTFSKLTLVFNPEKETFNYTRALEKRVAINRSRLYDFCVLNEHQFLLANDNDIFETTKRFSRSCMGLYQGHTNRVISVCKLNDQQFLSSSWDKTIKLWTIGKYEPVSSIDLDEVAWNLRISDNKLFHTEGKAIIIRNIESLEITEKIDLSEADLRCFDLSEHKKTLVAGDEAGNVYIKNLK